MREKNIPAGIDPQAPEPRREEQPAGQAALLLEIIMPAELLGRIPILVSLSPLSLKQLVSILTEPRNSLVKQFIALFDTYNIELKFSTGALHAIAERALAPATGSTADGKTSGGG